MTRCQLEPRGDDRWECTRCGRAVVTGRRADGATTIPDPAGLGPCGGANVSLPGRVSAFTLAMIQWIRAGCPVRSAADMQRLIEICRACPHYGDGYCRVCGCRISATGRWRNKLAMATETCPLGRWPVIEAESAGRSDPGLSDFCQRVYLINLRRRPDRLAACLWRLKTHGWPFRWPTVYPAIDGDVVGVPPDWQSGSGAYGCRMSHLRILQDCLMDGVETVMVLEDDAEIRPGFPDAVAEFLASVPGDWQGIMLGGQHHAPPQQTGIPGVVRVTYAQRTHAYIARRDYMQALQTRWANCTVHIDWVMRDWQHQFRVYAPTSWLVGQAGGRSDVKRAPKPPEWWQAEAEPEAKQVPLVVLRAADREVVERLERDGWHFGYWRDSEGRDHGLNAIAALPPGPERSERLRKWIGEIKYEAAAVGAVPTLWHGGIMSDEAERFTAVCEIVASTADDAERALPEEIQHYRDTWRAANGAPIAILDAPEPVCRDLERAGWVVANGQAAAPRQLRAIARQAYQQGRVLGLRGVTRDEILAALGNAEVMEIQASSADEALRAYLGRG